MPHLRKFAGLICGGLFCVAFAGACSASVHVGTTSPEIPQAEVQTQTADQLAASTNQPKPTITCPGALAAKVGATMDCVLVAQGDPTRLGVHLVVDSISGSTAHWNIVVGTTPLGDKAAFCADNATLDKATSASTSAADIIPILKANLATIDTFEKNAPPEIRPDAETLVKAARAAVSSNDASSLGDPSFAAAGTKVDAYCGQNSDGSPATSAP